MTLRRALSSTLEEKDTAMGEYKKTREKLLATRHELRDMREDKEAL